MGKSTNVLEIWEAKFGTGFRVDGLSRSVGLFGVGNLGFGVVGLRVARDKVETSAERMGAIQVKTQGYPMN